MTSPALDRRAALKARHRDAIVDAARELVDERGGPTFTVDELATRADVARRTVFNHFTSLDEIMLTVCEHALSDVVDAFLARIDRTPVGDGSRAAMFDEIASAMRASDLVTAISTMVRILGKPEKTDDRAGALTQSAFARVSGRLLAEVGRRHPGVDALDAELLVDSLMGGLVVIASHWVETTNGMTGTSARAAWDTLLDRLIVSVRTGYLPEH
ncbi:TetR/AcrR family transcriptional regulator [Curtobacterium sp. RRHDQ10]|uniref:TetR/AcrR family transcriptional regulator n=1 Tax=Curtobacterium phyllosphaerae TaxID=3413379 RepID=UPI003BF2C646